MGRLQLESSFLSWLIRKNLSRLAPRSISWKVPDARWEITRLVLPLGSMKTLQPGGGAPVYLRPRAHAFSAALDG